MKIYRTLPDDKQFAQQTSFDLCVLFLTAFLLAGLVVVGGIYKWSTDRDKRVSRPILEHIDEVIKR